MAEYLTVFSKYNPSDWVMDTKRLTPPSPNNELKRDGGKGKNIEKKKLVLYNPMSKKQHETFQEKQFQMPHLYFLVKVLFSPLPTATNVLLS